MKKMNHYYYYKLILCDNDLCFVDDDIVVDVDVDVVVEIGDDGDDLV